MGSPERLSRKKSVEKPEAHPYVAIVGGPDEVDTKPETHPYAAIVGGSEEDPVGPEKETLAEHPYAAIIGGAEVTDMNPEEKKEDDIYHMVTEGMEEAKRPTLTGQDGSEAQIALGDGSSETGGMARIQQGEVARTGTAEHHMERLPRQTIRIPRPIILEAAYTDLGPVLPGQNDPEAQRDALRPASLTRYGNLAPFERPSQRVGAPGTTVKEGAFSAPTSEVQEQRRAKLAELREALVRIEQDEYAKVVGADTGAYYEAHQKALKEYDAARAEFIAGDISRYSQEQMELMKKRGEGHPGVFERSVAWMDKWKRGHPRTFKGISGALLGIGYVFPPAWVARHALTGMGAFLLSYETMRRTSLNGVFGRGGVKNRALQGLEKVKSENLPEELTRRMAALAAYARIQGYWDDVKGPYEQLNNMHRAQMEKMTQGLTPEEKEKVLAKYSSKQIRESRDAFDERLWKEELKKKGRVAGAVGVGALAGGLLNWLWGTPPVEKPSGTAGVNSAPWTGADVPPAEVKSAPWTGADVPPAEVGNAPWVGTDVPLEGGAEGAPWVGTDVPLESGAESAPWTGADIPSPSPEVLESIMEHIPAEHGLRPEYYDLIKDESAADFLGRGRFATSFDRQYPWPKVDGEYPGIIQSRISEIRVGPYVRLQGRMGEALAALSPEQVEAAKKLSVSEFLKQIMGTTRSAVGSASTSL